MPGSDSLCHTLPLSLCVLHTAFPWEILLKQRDTSWCKLEEIFLLMKSHHTEESRSLSLQHVEPSATKSGTPES